MGIYDYAILGDKEKWDELWLNGIHLVNIVYRDAKFSLYSLHRFYVEIELDSSTNAILNRKVFKSGYSLSKYIDHIKL